MQGFTGFLIAMILLFSITNKIILRTIDRNQHDFENVFTTEEDKKVSEDRFKEEKNRNMIQILESIGMEIFL
jgi:hypothetical protein